MASYSLDAAVCQHFSLSEHEIYLDGPIGNLPRLQVFSSIHNDTTSPTSITTDRFSDVLQITSNDGRNDNVKECNGAGTCNYETGLCDCDHGFEFDADMGPCGKIVVNTSDWHGLARCPGLVSNDEEKTDWSNIKNREFMYVSMNWRDTHYVKNVHENLSTIHRFPYGSPKDNAPYIDDTDGIGIIVVTLTSNVSAGPLLLDKARDHVYFVDQNPLGPFIGRFNISYNASEVNYDIWLALSRPVVGFTMDAHFNRRRIYWTHPMVYGDDDGKIMWASLDATPVVANDITAAIGQDYVVDPGGIAVHIHRQRLFWLDRDLTIDPFGSVLRSTDLDGGNVINVYLYR